jgi:ubiquinone/menaquinone biosynthesis C-methylase UbiE
LILENLSVNTLSKKVNLSEFQEVATVSALERIEFKFISFMHSTLYGIFVNPFDMLRDAGVSKGQRVLEVGFGPGFFTIPAAKIVGPTGHTYAIDINPVALEAVQKKVKKEGLENVSLELQDVSNTMFEDECMDLCFFFGVFHSFKDTDSVVSEMHRILVPQGLMSIQSGRMAPEKIKRLVIKKKMFILENEGKRILQFCKQ